MSYTTNERVIRRNVSFLLDTLTMDDFATTYEGKKSDLKKTYDKLIKYLNSKLTETNSYVKYDYIKGRSDGRLFGNNSIQNVPCEYRTFITDGLVSDIDVKNCHPIILAQLCEEHDFHCPNLNDYIANRAKHLQAISNYDSINLVQAKKKVLVSVNDSKKMRTNCPFLKAFDEELKGLQKKFLDCLDYEYIKDYARNEGNFNGSFLNHLLCINEEKILASLRECCELNDIKIHSLFFDGLMVYGDINPSTLEVMCQHIRHNTIFTKCELTIKQHEHGFVVPIDYCPKTRTTYEDVKETFERDNCKVGVQFVNTKHEDFNAYSKYDFSTLHEELTYINGEGKSKPFIPEWLVDANKRRYDKFDSFPKDAMCPHYVYNMWEKFPVQLIEPTHSHKTGKAVRWFLQHINTVLADNNEEHSNFIKMWIAQMFQYPEHKSIFLMFVGKEGSGKGTFVRFLETLMGGSHRCWVCNDPQEQIFGKFNDMMRRAFVVILDEVDKSGTYNNIGRFKNLITEPTITINPKGKTSFAMNSYHRYMGFSNNPDPSVKMKRRDFTFRMSDHRINDTEYFNEGNSYANDLDCCKAIYDYFMTYPTKPKINDVDIPVGDYNEMLREEQKDVITEFMEDFVYLHNGTITFTVVDLYERFLDYCKRSHVPERSTMTKQRFASDLGFKAYSGISRKKNFWCNGRNNNGWVFDFEKLKELFKVEGVEEELMSDDEIL